MHSGVGLETCSVSQLRGASAPGRGGEQGQISLGGNLSSEETASPTEIPTKTIQFKILQTGVNLQLMKQRHEGLTPDAGDLLDDGRVAKSSGR